MGHYIDMTTDILNNRTVYLIRDSSGNVISQCHSLKEAKEMLGELKTEVKMRKKNPKSKCVFY